MPYELISERNITEGFHQVIIYVNDITTGLFINLTLFSIWIILLLGLYFNMKRETARGDFPQAFAVASFVTMVLTIILRTIPGLVSGWTLLLTIIVAVIGVVWFIIFSKEK